ncbi:ATP-binding protein [Noviherbaspirillum sp. CPCC 100848]|uniref:histidine kinase n=1 Tax=Noviherbaspirillum album TaxID=3080276 RepID=A0ABU6JE56_9BURK|nr:ATP-binding protein [Noviherbaspirillum sp. CPCC 100848]MEC4721942.1 ATP-binding protein [Noviherbaspirillum sp. CPCC 100848]
MRQHRAGSKSSARGTIFALQRNVLESSQKHTTRPGFNITAWIVIAFLSLTAAWTTYHWTLRKGYALLDDVSVHQLDLYFAGLESELGRHEYLPGLLELDPDILTLLDGTEDKALAYRANRWLASLSVRAGSVAIFAIDTKGIVRASSNWYHPQNLIGQNLSNALYFTEALKEGRYRYFAPNVAHDAPEFYFSQSIRRNGAVIGVAVVKISLAPIESTWTASLSHPQGEKLLIVDENDMIVMSSVADWKYQITNLASVLLQEKPPHPDDAVADESSSEVIRPLGMVIDRALEHGNYLVRMPRANPSIATPSYMTQERFMVRTGWRVITLSDASDVVLNARYAALGTGAFTAFLGVLSLYVALHRRAIRSQLMARRALQRAHNQLERKVDERTAELHESNQELMREIAERKRTEQVLREAQDELVQASKLAVLGQMAAGITHEINQPLTALRSVSHNAKLSLQRGNHERIGNNLDAMVSLVERMSRITAQLKSFARKAPLTMGSVVLAQSVDNVLLLMNSRIRSEQAVVHVDLPAGLSVVCDNNRLEQVLINLFANALDAMKDCAHKTLSVTASRAGERVMVRIADSGPGISDDILPLLFEPFFSTKPAGEGLGLGLAISSGIVHEFGGTLRARNDNGAVFEFDLKVTEEAAHV